MADLEAQVPERIERVFHDLFRMWRQLVRQQKHQIDVRERCQLAAPIAARGDHRHLLSSSWIGGRVDAAQGKFVDQAHYLIHQIRVCMRGLRAASFDVFKAATHLLPAGSIGTLKDFEDLALGFRRVSRPRHQFFQLSFQGFAVNDLAGLSNTLLRHGGPIS